MLFVELRHLSKFHLAKAIHDSLKAHPRKNPFSSFRPPVAGESLWMKLSLIFYSSFFFLTFISSFRRLPLEKIYLFFLELRSPFLQSLLLPSQRPRDLFFPKRRLHLSHHGYAEYVPFTGTHTDLPFFFFSSAIHVTLQRIFPRGSATFEIQPSSTPSLAYLSSSYKLKRVSRFQVGSTPLLSRAAPFLLVCCRFKHTSFSQARAPLSAPLPFFSRPSDCLV